MPLNPPTLRDIARRIQLRLAGVPITITDLTVISVLRILIEEMIAPEFATLWAGLVRAQQDWFIQTAAGAALDRRLADYGVTRPGARAAYGTVDVTVSAPVNVLPGTVVRTDPSDGSAPKRYQVRPNGQPDATLGESDGSWHVDSTRTIDVIALNAGASGNIAAGLITATETSISQLTELTNASPILNGSDAASDAEFRQLFRDYLLSLTRGTRGALLAALRAFVDPTGRRVHSAAFEEWGGATLLDAAGRPVALQIYIDEGSGAGAPGQALADPGLVSAVQHLVDGTDTETASGWRADGVPTAVLPAMAAAIAVTVAVDIDRAFTPSTVTQAVKDAILTHFAQLPVSGVGMTGEPRGQLSLARLFRAVEDVSGVLRASFLAPRADVAIPTGYKAVVFQLHVTGQVVP